MNTKEGLSAYYLVLHLFLYNPQEDQPCITNPLLLIQEKMCERYNLDLFIGSALDQEGTVDPEMNISIKVKAMKAMKTNIALPSFAL